MAPSNQQLTEQLTAMTAERDQLRDQLAELNAELTVSRSELDDANARLEAAGPTLPPPRMAPDDDRRYVTTIASDTMESVADHFGVSVDALLAANSDLLNQEARARGHDRAVITDAAGQRVGIILPAGVTLVLP